MDDFLYAIWKFIQERESEFYQTHKEEKNISHIKEKASNSSWYQNQTKAVFI